jgi:hypothetical protein
MSLELYSMKAMGEELKLAFAEPGKAEKYLPWYGSAGLGAIGHEVGKRALPGKLKTLGAIGGAVLGAGLGVHGGEALGRKIDQRKSRRPPEDDPPMSIQPVPGPQPPAKLAAAEKKKPSAGRVLGSSLLGMGAGMGAGYGASKGLHALSRATGGKGLIPSTAARAMPFVGGAIGMTAPLLHYATLQNMREEHAKKQEQDHGG